MALEATEAVLAEHGMTAEDFAALSERDQQNLLNETPDDTIPADDPNGTAAPAPAPAAPAPAPTAAPMWKAAPAPAPADAPAASPAPTAAPAAPAAPTASPAPTSAPAAAEVPLFDLGSDEELVAPRASTTPEDATKLTTLKAEKTTLFDQFADGKLTRAEYDEKLAPIETQIEDLAANVAADKAAAQMHRRDLESRWTRWVDTAFKQSKEQGGIDYELPENADKLKALDENVKRFAQAAPLMHPEMTATQRDKWALAQGHEATAKAFGYTRTTAAAPTPPAPAPAPKPGTRAAPDLTQLPPTLRSAPPAGDPGVHADEFAHLDNMSLGDREKAVAMMTPEQERRYLDR